MMNYLKVAWRHLIRDKGYSFINIAGLALGMAVFILIFLWIHSELNYDRFHENMDEICRVESNQNFNGRILHIYWTPHPLGPALKEEIPVIQDAARAQNLRTQLIRYGAKTFEENDVWSVDPSFLGMFTFPLVKGDPDTVLSGINSMVITERLAGKIFGAENPIGKVVNMAQTADFTITGILQDIPANSTLQFDVLIPYSYLDSIGQTDDNFSNNQTFTWVRLQPGTSADDAGARIRGFVRQKVPRSRMNLELLPLSKVHLYTYSGYQKNTAIQSVALFSIIGLLVLIIACINFMSLTTARCVNRAREVGIRKVTGARRGQLIRQFCVEPLLYSTIALGFAVAMVSIALPVFSSFTGMDISWRSMDPGFLAAGLAGFTVLTGLISGSYPALFLASFQPVDTLKGRMKLGKVFFRHALVVIQFSLTIGLIIGTSLVSRQVSYINNKELGWDKEQVVAIPIRSYSRSSLAALKTELGNVTGISNLAVATQKPSFTSWSSSGFDWEGKDPTLKVDVTYLGVDDGYLDTMGMTVVRGRNFSRKFPGDKTGSFLVNEELARLMGDENPVGKSFSFWEQEGKIVGVVKDFHFQPLRRKIEPLVIKWAELEWTHFLFLRILPGRTAETMELVAEIWGKLLPGIPFRYQFTDEDFARIYNSEKQTGALLKVFTALAMLVACLGLFGLASYTAEQKTKEIGIRKVLGARISSLLVMMVGGFSRLVFIASFVAWPLSYLLMKNWLDHFSYRTSINIWIFVYSGLLAMAVAVLTVGYQSFKAARANPVESLRYE